MTGSTLVALFDIPEFKTPDGIGFPIVQAGGSLAPDRAESAAFWVMPCDRLFEAVVGAACGGPAEDEAVATTSAALGIDPAPTLVTRFDASPRTSVSIYALTGPATAP